MNKSYRVIFNADRDKFVVASEFAKGRGKSGRTMGAMVAFAGVASLFSVGAFAGVGTEVGCSDSGADKTTVAIGGRGCSPGGTAKANGSSSIAIGNGSAAGYGTGGVGKSISGLVSGNDFQVALGAQSTATGRAAAALGWKSLANGIAASALGYGANAAGNSSLAIGDSASANGVAALALGGLANSRGRNAAALGARASAVGNYSNAFGSGAVTKSDGSTAVGANSFVDVGSDNAVAVGNGAVVGMGAQRSMAIGSGATVAPALVDSVAFGSGATVSSYESLAMGAKASVGGYSDNSMAIGNGAKVGDKAWSSTAIGHGAVVNDYATNATALGQGSVADRSDTISVGSVGRERWITNVKAGLLDTDAVNVAQLKDTGLITVDPSNPNGALTSMALTYDDAKKRSVTLGGKGASTPVALKNVAAGTDGADAVNLTQMNGATQAIRDELAAGTLDMRYVKVDATGVQANAAGLNSVAIGSGANANGSGALALGAGARAQGLNSVALGLNSVATQANTVSVGHAGAARKIVNVAEGDVSVNSTDAINGSQLYDALNSMTTTFDQKTQQLASRSARSIAIRDVDGPLVAIEGMRGKNTASLNGSDAASTTAVAVGSSSVAAGGNAVAVGLQNVAGSNNAVAIGSFAQTGAESDYATAIGSYVQTTGAEAVAIGANVEAGANNSLVIGSNHARAVGAGSVALGNNARVNANATDSIAVGTNAAVATKVTNALALGAGATVAAGANGGVALGQGSVANRGNAVSVGGGTVGQRQIINVAAGTATTDAVNVSQLSGLTTALGGGAAIGTNGNITQPTYTVGGKDYRNVGEALTALDENTGTGTDPNAVAYDDAKKSAVTLGGKEASTQVALKNVAAGTDDTDAVNVAQLKDSGLIAVDPSNPNGALTSMALTYDDAKKSSVTLGGKEASTPVALKNVAAGLDDTDAVNVAQLKDSGLIAVDPSNPNGALTSMALTYDDAKKSSVTLGGKEASTPVALKNVAAGTDDTDAVNVAQLKDSGLITVDPSNPNGALTSMALTYDDAKKSSVTLGGKEASTPVALKNVAAGTDGADAVNLTQMNSATQAIRDELAAGTLDMRYIKVNTAGVRANAAGLNSVAIGSGANANGSGALALGAGARAQGLNSVALGFNSVAMQANTVSVGHVGAERKIVNVAEGDVSVDSTDAINGSQLYDALNSMTTTFDQKTQQLASRSIGIRDVNDPLVAIEGMRGENTASLNGSDAASTTAVAVGSSSVAAGGNAVAVGLQNVAGSNNAVAIGSFAQTGAESDYATAIGSYVQTTGAEAVAIGANVEAGANNALVIGSNHARAVGAGSVALGNNARVNANATDSIAVGTNAAVATRVTNALALGAGATVADGASGGVALGQGSVANRGNAVSVGGGTVGQRQIINVAAGTDDTDAVNVAQLKQAGLADANGNALSAVTYDTGAKDTVTLSGTNGTVIGNLKAGTVSDTSMDAINGSQLAKMSASVAAAIGGGSTMNSDGTISLPTFNIGGQQIHSVGDALTNLDTRTTANATAIDSLASQVNNLSSGGMPGGASGNTVTYDSDDQSQVTLNNGSASTKVTNVAVGDVSADSTDAVNGSQLHSTNAKVDALAQAVQNVGESGNSQLATNPGGDAPPAMAGGDGSVALGSGANSGGDGSVALGNGANSSGNGSLALGNGSKSTGDRSVAVGGGSNASGTDSLALGHNAAASAENSVALGANSVADQPNTVSVGAPDAERRITNVAPGIAGTDAVNVNQLNAGLNDVRRKAFGGVAAATALTMIPDVDVNKTLSIGIGGGTFQGYAAVAFGGTARITENIKVRAGAGWGSGGTTAGVGASYQW